MYFCIPTNLNRFVITSVTQFIFLKSYIHAKLVTTTGSDYPGYPGNRWYPKRSGTRTVIRVFPITDPCLGAAWELQAHNRNSFLLCEAVWISRAVFPVYFTILLNNKVLGIPLRSTSSTAPCTIVLARLCEKFVCPNHLNFLLRIVAATDVRAYLWLPLSPLV